MHVLFVPQQTQPRGAARRRLLVIATGAAWAALAGCRGPASGATSTKAARGDLHPTPVRTEAISATQAAAPKAAAALAAHALAAPATASAAEEIAAYRERRRRRPAVIGGCGARCETPEDAVANLLDRLQRDDERIEALHECFEWSLLVVDGQPRGERWSNLWARPAEHAKRRDEIDTWLRGWSAFAAAAGPTKIAASAASAQLEPADKSDRKERVFTWRPPADKDGRPVRGESTWRLTLHQRGHEWLISRVEHSPSQRPGRPAASAGARLTP